MQLATAAVASVLAGSALAASATWSASPSSGNWIPGASDTNWSAGIAAYPGATSGTTNADTATFLTTSNASITLDQPLNIKFFVFGDATSTAPAAYTFSGTGALNMTSGGSMIYYAPNTNTYASPVVQTLNLPMVILPASGTTAGSFSFGTTSGSSTNGNAGFNVQGTIAGGSTTAAVTLNLGRSAIQSTISGTVSDGQAAAGLNLTVSSSVNGSWKVSGANTYTGKTSILGGIMEVSSLNSVSTNVTLGTVHAASSNLGAPITIANGTIDLGINSSGATLKYIGAGETTDRVINASANAAATIDSSGTGALIFTSNFTIGGNDAAKGITLRGTSTASNEIKGAISNGASLRVVSLTKNDAGTWVLSGANTYSGTTTLNAGTLGIGSNSALGTTGTLSLGNATTIEARGGNRTLAGSLNVNGSFTVGGSYELAFDGALAVSNSYTLTAGNGATLTINGAGSGLSNSATNRTLTINGAGTVNLNGGVANNIGSGTSTASGIAYSGSGTLVLAGTNTYGGNTAVNSGKVLVNGTLTAGASVGASGTLGGTGTISGLVSSAGAIAPGGHQALTFGNGLSLTGGSVAIDIAANGTYDAVKLTGGNAALGTNLASLNLTSSYAGPSTTFWIVDNTGAGSLSGTFSNLADGASVTLGSATYTIHYNANHELDSLSGGNDVALAVIVPEPTSALMLTAGLLVTGGLSRRRRA